MDKKRKQKNMLIGGLLAIVLIMAVGYAAFATQLNITGTANVTSTWGVEIISVTPDKTATQTNNVYTTPGDITHSIGSNKLSAEFSSALIKPGDSVTYTIVVQNKGTIDATLSNVTKTNSNNAAITFEISGLTNGEKLAAGASKTFTATVGYSSSVEEQPSSTTSSFGVTLNYVQYGTNTSSSNTIYAINTDLIYKDTSTLTDIGTTYNSCSATGKNVCLKYTIENDTVTGAEVCFIKGGSEHCLKGWVDECLWDDDADNGNGACTFTGTPTIFNSNKSVLNTAFTEENACYDNGSDFGCNASGLNANAFSLGDVSAGDDSWRCDVNSDGFAGCGDYGGK